jgi:hypothetical protein
MRAGVAQGEIISPFLFNLYVSDMPPPSHNVKLALYADDTAFITTSRKPALLINYLALYLTDLEWWLREWRIAINVSKFAAMLFAKNGKRVHKPRQVQILGKPIHWVDSTRYLGVTPDTLLTWSPHVVQARKKPAQRLGVLGRVLNRRRTAI